MRIVARLLSCAGLALGLAACTAVERAYLRDGIGTELLSTESADAAGLEDTYFGHLCRRAGFASSPIAPFACRLSTAAEWSTLVQAGMNDIDQRCDGYLAWLDSRKRSSTSLLQQIGDSSTAVDALLVATGAGVQPLALAAAAFGLARNTASNYYSRLLFDVDQSTVQTVVLTRQKRFREYLPRQIDNRPAAVYALRSYLRLCMPYTIETQINTTVKLYERGGLEALEVARDDPVIDARTVRTAVIGSATEPLPAGRRQTTVRFSTRLDPYEEKLDEGYIRRVQRALCIAPTGDLGGRASPTRRAIADYLVGRGQPPAEIIDQRLDAFIDEAVEKVVMRGPGSCAAAGFKTSGDVGRSFPR